MRRKSGFKITIPYIITAMAESGLPIFIACDCTGAELTVKPGNQHLDTLPKNIYRLLEHYPEVGDFLVNCTFDFLLLEGNALHEQLYLEAAILFALFEEGYLAEDIHGLLETIQELTPGKPFEAGFMKTITTGGIHLSTSICHERLYGSKGLFFIKADQDNYTEDVFYPIESAALITSSLLKDNMSLLGKVLQLLEGQKFQPHHPEHLGNIQSPNSPFHYKVILVKDTDGLKNYTWIAGVNQDGSEVC